MTDIKNNQETEISQNLDSLFGDDEPIFEFDDTGSPVVLENTNMDSNSKKKGDDSKVSDDTIELKQVCDTDDKKNQEKADIKNTSLENLKVIILSNEWEINFNNFQKIIDEIKKIKVKENYTDNEPILKLFKIMESLSKYLLKYKINSKQEAFNAIETTYKNIEILFSKSNISKQEQDQIVTASIKDFKKLKALIAHKSSEKTPDDLIKAAVKRIKIFIKKEIALLRQELKT